MGLGDEAAGVDLVAGIILQGREIIHLHKSPRAAACSAGITLSKAGYTALSSVSHP